MGSSLLIFFLLALSSTWVANAIQLRKAVTSSMLAPLIILSPVSATTYAEEPPIGANRNTIPSGEIVPSQLAPSDLVDINAATVDTYKKFPGLYPHGAGLIASHGPYSSVKELFNIDTATEQDKRLFRKYMRDFTALPPGRMFVERLNARQSM